ncbi:glycerate kinase type-2 family protein [Novisyntrophococcus fermenticellae]|uniref:glycerate kinase type-2 family protein n=1 Tax=Novisyntrophococcus fermenticellae TaxID=2068655 RepID=UPI001E41F166|nr:glycerate kinase [Novisyntrophococcus fermenticellae]
MIKNDFKEIVKSALNAAKPDTAVEKALTGRNFGDGKTILIAIGKAAWQMTKTAVDILGDKISEGVVITKYEHSKGSLEKIDIYEAGHPMPDANSVTATQAAIDAVTGLTVDDTVLFLVSGGGSALFEKPLIPFKELESITEQLLGKGADIVEMNTIRKRLSAVKGGRFAKLCEPANVFSIVLSDIIGDPLDMIASGPAFPDRSTSEQALKVIEKYDLTVSEETKQLLRKELPKRLDNVETMITGSVSQLCEAACKQAETLGYKPFILTDSLTCTARDAGSFLAAIARYHSNSKESLAFIAGGETVVKLTGKGKGGRNQEIALAAAYGISGLKDTAVFSVGSDGTDGPTDAAGGYVDGESLHMMEEKKMDLFSYLNNNDAYNALRAIDGLVITGPTGTNVNDLSVVLIQR